MAITMQWMQFHKDNLAAIQHVKLFAYIANWQFKFVIIDPVRVEDFQQKNSPVVLPRQ